MITNEDIKHLREAIKLSGVSLKTMDGGPFGALVVDEKGKVIGRGYNKVSSSLDPTAHAEIVAIREACESVQSHQLEGCTVYSSCEPCPMCLGAIYWARPSRLVFASTREDAAHIGFDDHFIYNELTLSLDKRKIKTENALRDEGREVMKAWRQLIDKKLY